MPNSIWISAVQHIIGNDLLSLKQTESAVSLHFHNIGQIFLFRPKTTFSIFCSIENKCFDFFETCRGTARKHVSLTLPIAMLLQNLLGKGKHVQFGGFYKVLYLSSTISNNLALKIVRKRLLGYTQFALCFFIYEFAQIKLTCLTVKKCWHQNAKTQFMVQGEGHYCTGSLRKVLFFIQVFGICSMLQVEYLQQICNVKLAHSFQENRSF